MATYEAVSYQTPTVHHPTAIVEIPDVTTNPTSLLIPVNPVATTRLSIAHIHPIEGIIAAIVIVGDELVVPRQNLYINCIKLYIRTRVHIGVWHAYWHDPTPIMHHTTIKWGRSAVSMRG